MATAVMVTFNKALKAARKLGVTVLNLYRVVDYVFVHSIISADLFLGKLRFAGFVVDLLVDFESCKRCLLFCMKLV